VCGAGRLLASLFAFAVVGLACVAPAPSGRNPSRAMAILAMKGLRGQRRWPMAERCSALQSVAEPCSAFVAVVSDRRHRRLP
jgi:hypothetical protein